MIKIATMPAASLIVSLAAALMSSGCDRLISVENRLTRASESLDAGEYQAALIDVRKALKEEPDNLRAQLLDFDILSRSGEYELAQIALQRAVAAGASPASTEGRRLRLLIALGELDAADLALAAAGTLEPADRHLFEGQLLLQRRRPAEAAAAFEFALAATPGLLPAELGRIEALARQGQAAMALQFLEAILEQDPGSGLAWLLKGTLDAQAGRFEAAMQGFGKAIRQDRGLTRPELIQAHAALVSAALAAGRAGDAREALAGLETAAGDSVMVSLVRARLALATGDSALAVSELRKYTSSMPADTEGRKLLVAALLEQGMKEQAYSEAVRMAADFPGQDAPKLALAEVQIRLGRTADAESTLTGLATRIPPNPQAMAMLGQIRIQRGESLAGVGYLEQGLSERPEDPNLKLQLAAAYVATGRASRALDLLDAIEDGVLAPTRDRLRVIATAALHGPSAAQSELGKAIERNPHNADLLGLAAAYHAGAGNPALARDFLRRARTLRPDDARLALALGRLELGAGALGEAEKLARLVLEQEPGSVAAMLLMAGIASQRGQDADIDHWLQLARDSDPRSLEVSMVLARRALAQGQSAKARSILADAERDLALAPDSAPARLALGELNSATGQYSKALGHLHRALELEPDSPVILLSLARIQLAEGETESARRTLWRALQVAPGWLPAAGTLAALESNEGNLAAAVAVAHDLRKRDPANPVTYMLEGEAYLAAGRPDVAAPLFATAYARAPSARMATGAARARLQAKAGNPDAELLDWLKRNPGDAATRLILADLYIETGKRVPAIKQLESVLQSQADNVTALNNLAWMYHENGDGRGLATAARAYALASEVVAVADTYGWILVNAGDVKEGLPILVRAAGQEPGNGEIQYHLAFALAKAGRREESAAMLRKLLDSSTGHFPSRSDAERMLADLGG